jgi:VIT1/CCC1 family predicted Fe2+/Mn2+ transporter
MSMAVGEYVSVNSQRDAERADVEREKRELAGQPEAELAELSRPSGRSAASWAAPRPPAEHCALLLAVHLPWQLPPQLGAP